MYRFVCSVACVAVLVYGTVLRAGNPPLGPPVFVEAKPYIPRDGAVNAHFYGTVLEITKTSIRIEWPKEETRTFLLSETLAAGKVPSQPRTKPGPNQYFVMPSDMYRITDIKAGDIVSIRYARLGDTYICDHISIEKRPGGLVPPLPEEAEKLLMRRPITPGVPLKNPHIAYHEWMNAKWDLEDNGIPYPEKFGRNRRFPAAPMPREAKPKP